MYLRAILSSGFSEHLVRWTLEADNGLAIIEASWFDNGNSFEKIFEMDFEESRIQECALALAKLKSNYDGHTDDTPTLQLLILDGDRKLVTTVHTGFHWPDEEQIDIDLFMKVWRPIVRDVEKFIDIPSRNKKRKK